MVGPKRTCMAVRKGDGTIQVDEIKQSEHVSFFETVPFIRGCIRFYKMLVTGTGALMKSADISEEGRPEEEEPGKSDARTDDTNGEASNSKSGSRLDDFLSRHYNLVITLSAVLGILLSVGLFILLPRLIVDLGAKFIPDRYMERTWMAVAPIL